LVYSNPLDFEPEELVPLKLSDDDFLPFFENISYTDDWQQQQQQAFLPELSPWPLSLSLPPLQPLSDMMEFDFGGWDFQLPACQYDYLTMTVPGVTSVSNELDFALLPPTTDSWLNEYGSSHVPLFPTLQQLWPDSILNSSWDLNDLAVQQLPLP
jgi:hypothetical protein